MISSSEQVEEIVKVNFLGEVYAIDFVLPSMLLRKLRSQIRRYREPRRDLPELPLEEAYNASKAALAIYLEGLRPALRRRGIAVTTVFPGFVHTPLLGCDDGLHGNPTTVRLDRDRDPRPRRRSPGRSSKRRRVCCFHRTTTSSCLCRSIASRGRPGLDQGIASHTCDPGGECPKALCGRS